MTSFGKSFLAASFLSLPLWAGALLVAVASPPSNPEALRNHAVLLARITACHSPAKTTVVATAEGTVNGIRQSIPLKVIALSTAGTFAVSQQWPPQGNWAIKMVATNPEYQDYATSVVVPVRGGSLQLTAAKHYFRAPTGAELNWALN